jgi:hypothetical protein
MSQLTIDALMQNCFLYKLQEKQLVSCYQHNGQVFALWSRDSSFAIDPKLEHQVQFGIVRFCFDANDCLLLPVQENNLFLEFTDSYDVENREVTSHLFHDGRIVFSFSERFSGDGKWGKHNYVIAYNIDASAWEIGHSLLETGEISFKLWSPRMGSREELSIAYGELELFFQGGQLKVGIDHTPYHLDDWTRDTDFAKVAPSPESPHEKWRRQGSIIISEDRSGEEPCAPAYGSSIPLISSDTKVTARIPAVRAVLTFENIAAVVMREFDAQYTLGELCYTAQHIYREADQEKLPLVHTLSQEEKGVPLTGKLSDLLLAHPAPVVPPAKYALIPAIRHADSVLACTKTGANIAALVVDTLHRTSCVLFVPLSDLI